MKPSAFTFNRAHQMEKVLSMFSALLFTIPPIRLVSPVLSKGVDPASVFSFAGVTGTGLAVPALAAGFGALLFIRFFRGGREKGKGGAEKPASGPQGHTDPFLGTLKRADEGFDTEKFCKMAADLFVRVQSAWKRRDLERVKKHLTEDLFQGMTNELEKAVARGSVNHIEDITVRAPAITGAWQDEGLDFATVRITVDATALTTGRDGLPLGEAPKKVSFTEHWTFVREAWMGDWRLTAIGRERG